MKYLECAKCGKHMATLRDANVRIGMVVYCAACNSALKPEKQKSTDVPDFLNGLFRAKH